MIRTLTSAVTCRIVLFQLKTMDRCARTEFVVKGDCRQRERTTSYYHDHYTQWKPYDYYRETYASDIES